MWSSVVDLRPFFFLTVSIDDHERYLWHCLLCIHKFPHVVFLFSFAARYFLISIVTFSLIRRWFKSTLFNWHIFVDFQLVFRLLISNFIPLGPEKTPCVALVLNSWRLVLWSVLETISYALEKNDCSAVVRRSVLCTSLTSGVACHSSPLSHWYSVSFPVIVNSGYGRVLLLFVAL